MQWGKAWLNISRAKYLRRYRYVAFHFAPPNGGLLAYLNKIPNVDETIFRTSHDVFVVTADTAVNTELAVDVTTVSVAKKETVNIISQT